MKRSLLLSILFFLSLRAAMGAAGLPELHGRVNDLAGLLSADQEARLEALLKSYEEESSNQLVLAAVPSLEGEAIETYAVRLFEKWKLGDQKRDNGVLLVLAMEDRRMRIEVGYGLEGRLTDAISSAILRETLTPEFRNRRYFEGIYTAFEQIIAATRGEYQGTPKRSRSSKNNAGPVGLTLVILFFLLPVILSALKRRGAGWTVGHDGYHRSGWGGGSSWGGGGGSWGGGGSSWGGGGSFSGGGGSSGGGGASGSW